MKNSILTLVIIFLFTGNVFSAGSSGGELLEKGDYSVLVEGRIIPAILQRKPFAR